MSDGLYLVLDIGGTKIRSAIAKKNGQLLKSIKISTNSKAGAKEILKDLITISDQVINKSNVKQKELKGVGISFGGPVDFDKQKLVKSQHVKGWEKINIVKIFSKRYSIPCIVDNDANLAALGEKVFGAGKKVNNLLYLTISTGVGGGVVLDGKIWHGTHSLAGEIGHVILDKNGPVCFCGKKGCLEAISSGSALAKNTIKYLKNHPRKYTKIKKIVNNNLKDITAITIYQAARKNDPFAKSIVKSSISNLAIAISSAINIFDPGMIIIGGGITNEGSMFFKPLQKFISQYSMFKKAFNIPVVPAKLKDNAGLKGALASISNHLDEQ